MDDGGGNRLWIFHCGSKYGECGKRHESLRDRVEAGPGGRNDRWSGLAPVLGAVPYAPGFSRRTDGASRAAPSVWLPIPVVAAVGVDIHRGFKCRRSRDRPKRHETMREPMERRQGRWNDRRPDVAAVSVAMPRAPNLDRFVLGRFRSRAGP